MPITLKSLQSKELSINMIYRLSLISFLIMSSLITKNTYAGNIYVPPPQIYCYTNTQTHQSQCDGFDKSFLTIHEPLPAFHGQGLLDFKEAQSFPGPNMPTFIYDYVRLRAKPGVYALTTDPGWI